MCLVATILVLFVGGVLNLLAMAHTVLALIRFHLGGRWGVSIARYKPTVKGDSGTTSP